MKVICPECRELTEIESDHGAIFWRAHARPAFSGTITDNSTSATPIDSWCNMSSRLVLHVICHECKMKVSVMLKDGVSLNTYEGQIIPHISGGKSELCSGSYFDLRFDDLRTMEALEK